MTSTLIANPPQLLDLQGLATYLKVRPKTINNWRAVGKGPRGVKVGGALRFRPSDVEAWLDSQLEADGQAA